MRYRPSRCANSGTRSTAGWPDGKTRRGQRRKPARKTCASAANGPHGPEFNWGYGGSGPAQLALALAADVLGDHEAAQDVYQRLKFRVVGRLPHDGWSLTEQQLRQAIRDIQQRDQDRER